MFALFVYILVLVNQTVWYAV